MKKDSISAKMFQELEMLPRHKSGVLSSAEDVDKIIGDDTQDQTGVLAQLYPGVGVPVSAVDAIINPAVPAYSPGMLATEDALNNQRVPSPGMQAVENTLATQSLPEAAQIAEKYAQAEAPTSSAQQAGPQSATQSLPEAAQIAEKYAQLNAQAAAPTPTQTTPTETPAQTAPVETPVQPTLQQQTDQLAAQPPIPEPHLLPMTTDPLKVASVNRVNDELINQSVLDAQRRKNEIADQEAKIASEQLDRDALAAKEAFRLHEERMKRYDNLKKDALAEQNRRSNILARRAEERIAQRPGYQDRAVGRALLAISAGMGDQIAANLYNASLKEEENNQDFDIRAKNADISALNTSFNAATTYTDSVSKSMIDDMNIYNSMTLAREKVSLKNLEAGIAKLAPGKAQADGILLLNKLKADHADRQTKLAEEEVKSFLLRQKMMATGMPGKNSQVVFVPPERKEGESEEHYRATYINEKAKFLRQQNASAAKPDMSQLMTDKNIQKGGSSMKTGGGGQPQTTPQPTNQTPPTTSVPSDVTTKPATKSAGAKKMTDTMDSVKSAAAKKSQAATANENTPSKSIVASILSEVADLFGGGNKDRGSTKKKGVTVADLDNEAKNAYAADVDKTYSIPLGGDRWARPKDSSRMNITKDEVKDLRKETAVTLSIEKGLTKYSALVAQWNSKSITARDVLKRLGKKIDSSISDVDADSQAAAALQAMLLAEISVALGQGAMSEGDRQNTKDAVRDMVILMKDPESAATGLKSTQDFFQTKMAERLETSGYDSKEFNAKIDAMKAEVEAGATRPLTDKEVAEDIAKSGHNVSDQFANDKNMLGVVLGRVRNPDYAKELITTGKAKSPEFVDMFSRKITESEYRKRINPETGKEELVPVFRHMPVQSNVDGKIMILNSVNKKLEENKQLIGMYEMRLRSNRDEAAPIVPLDRPEEWVGGIKSIDKLNKLGSLYDKNRELMQKQNEATVEYAQTLIDNGYSPEQLIKMGYPKEFFVKKMSNTSKDKTAYGKTYSLNEGEGLKLGRSPDTSNFETWVKLRNFQMNILTEKNDKGQKGY